MKILIATGIFPPDLGGPATYVPAFATACALSGHSVRVVAYGTPTLEESRPYSVFRVPRLFMPFRHAFFFFTCLFRGFSADVFFAQDAFSSGVPAFSAAWLLRKRFVVKIVGDFSWEYARNASLTTDTIDAFQRISPSSVVVRLIRFLQGFVCRHAAHIIVPSAYLKGIVVGWGVDPRTVTVVYNAVPLPASIRAVRDSFTIFSAGRLVPWKGFDALIRAVAALRPSFSHLRLVIAGDGPCRDSLADCAKDHAVSDVVSLSGSLPPSAMARLYERASCFVLFSSYEGCSHVLLEALARRTPVIVSDAGGNSELITDGMNGIVVPSRDERALRDAIFSFFSRPEEAIPRPGFADEERFSPHRQLSMTCRLLAANP